MNWVSLKIDSEFDREKIVSILSKNGYEVRQTKKRPKAKTEYYIDYRDREEEEHDL